MATGDGTIITDGNGNYKIRKGGNWVPYSGPVPGAAKAGGAGGKLSQTNEKFFNDLRNQANDAAEARRIYEAAEKPINTFRPGPGRGRAYQIFTPEEGGGVMDTIGGVVGAIPRAFGAFSKPETDAYQQLRGYQSEQVLRRQLEQKGPQTESDAARLALTELSPSKTREVNMEIIRRGKERAARSQARAIHYQRFAQRWGLNGKDAQGRTADEIWSKEADKLTREIIGGLNQKKSKAGGITVISRTKVN